MSITIVEPSIEERIQRHIDSGQFADASEVGSHALDVMENEKKLRVRRELIAEADDEEERGEVISMSPDFWPSLWREADEEDERGDPILDHVGP